MLLIQDTIVSLEVLEKEFCCDLDNCKGCCCIEGDAGAPVTPEEEERLRAMLPELLPMMTIDRAAGWSGIPSLGYMPLVAAIGTQTAPAALQVPERTACQAIRARLVQRTLPDRGRVEKTDEK